jgi:hypothetical protein
MVALVYADVCCGTRCKKTLWSSPNQPMLQFWEHRLLSHSPSPILHLTILSLPPQLSSSPSSPTLRWPRPSTADPTSTIRRTPTPWPAELSPSPCQTQTSTPTRTLTPMPSPRAPTPARASCSCSGTPGRHNSRLPSPCHHPHQSSHNCSRSQRCHPRRRLGCWAAPAARCPGAVTWHRGTSGARCWLEAARGRVATATGGDTDYQVHIRSRARAGQTDRYEPVVYGLKLGNIRVLNITPHSVHSSVVTHRYAHAG